MVGPAKDKHQAPANRLKLTHHRAIKGEKIARNRDCVYNQACRLSHDNHVVSHSFIRFIYLSYQNVNTV